MKKINIAIDGPAGSGKGSVARILAQKLNYGYLDTGSMYRAFTLAMLRKKLNVEDFHPSYLENISITLKEGKVFLNSEDVSSKIRSSEVGANAAPFSRIPEVREFLTKQQQEIVKGKAYVAEGRDTTTIVIPDAELKVYLDASLDVRAKRRFEELLAKGESIDYETIKKQVKERDEIDKNKGKYSLQITNDAFVLDTSFLSIDEVVEKLHHLALERMRD